MIKKLLLLSLLISSISVFAASAGEMVEAKPMKKGDAEKGSNLSELVLLVTVQTEIVLWVSGQHLLGKEKVIL